ncbi:hydroxymethylbilane synthase [Alphaproteobacteria bacterium]|nr:hydroxymethylbilane synthase [Alphaproteobacteria bacterium]
MKLKIRIASRKSKLALCQVEILKSYFDLGIKTEIIEVITSGDQILNKSLSEIGGKGLFIKELEKFILDGSADIAVHSMKDMETEIAQNTVISAVLPRGDRSDVLLGKYSTLDDLPYNAVIGTSSVRRAAFTKSYRPDLVIKLLRGNVGTRIQKLEDGLFDAIILAKAGLDRLKINVGKQIPSDIMPPAATQGAIAIQSTTNRNNKYEKDLNNYLFNINDNETYFETLAERSLLKTLDGSCRSPISASAYIIENDRLKLYGAIARLDGTKVVKSEIVGLKKDAVLLGKNLGIEILSKANGEIIYK